MFKRIMCTIILVCLFANVAGAEFLDDWINQSTYSGPQYFPGSKRNIGTFGAYSARWRNSNDYLVGIQPPKWDAGCGGIDLFLGGFQFMEFQYLVEKLQRIMGPAAAAFAFEIALSVVSEKMSGSMKSFNAIIDRLNQLQFDDCDSQKTLTAVMKAGWDSGKYGQEATAAIAQHSLVNGIRDSWNEIKDFGKDSSVSAVQAASGITTDVMISACPQDIRDIYFTQGFVLDNLVTKLGAPYTADYAALIRGIIGDVFIERVATDYQPIPTEKCFRNAGPDEIKVDDFINGAVEKKQSDWTCVQAGPLTVSGIGYASIREYVQTMLANISTKIVNKAALVPAEQQFLTRLQAPVMAALEGYIKIFGSDFNAVTVADQFVDYVASDIVYYMVSDFSSQMGNAIYLGQSAYDKTGGSAGGNNQENCKLELASGTRDQLDVLHKRLSGLVRAVSDDYLAKRMVLANNLEAAQKMYELRSFTREATADRSMSNSKDGNPSNTSR